MATTPAAISGGSNQGTTPTAFANGSQATGLVIAVKHGWAFPLAQVGGQPGN